MFAANPRGARGILGRGATRVAWFAALATAPVTSVSRPGSNLADPIAQVRRRTFIVQEAIVGIKTGETRLQVSRIEVLWHRFRHRSLTGELEDTVLPTEDTTTRDTGTAAQTPLGPGIHLGRLGHWRQRATAEIWLFGRTDRFDRSDRRRMEPAARRTLDLLYRRWSFVTGAGQRGEAPNAVADLVATASRFGIIKRHGPTRFKELTLVSSPGRGTGNPTARA